MSQKTTNEISKDAPAKVKAAMKKQVLKENEITKEQEDILTKCWEEAKMPVEMIDADFKLGESELDVRKLSDENYRQMLFRMEALNIVYQRQITQSMVDLMRLVMILLEKNGVEDIVKATDELMTKLQNQVKQETKTTHKA